MSDTTPAPTAEITNTLIECLQNMMEWARELGDEALDGRREEFVADLKAAREAISTARGMNP